MHFGLRLNRKARKESAEYAKKNLKIEKMKLSKTLNRGASPPLGELGGINRNLCNYNRNVEKKTFKIKNMNFSETLNRSASPLDEGIGGITGIFAIITAKHQRIHRVHKEKSSKP